MKSDSTWRNVICGTARVSTPLLNIISQTFCLSGESNARQVLTDRVGTHTHTHTQTCAGFHSVVSCLCHCELLSSSSSSSWTHTRGSGRSKKTWEDRGCRNRWVLAPAKNPESDTNGPEERQRGTAPSGPDTVQPASSKNTDLETDNKMSCR